MVEENAIVLWLAAAMPIATLLILMVKCKWGTAQATPMALLVAILVAAILYDASWQLVNIEVAKGIWNGFIILTVIFPAVLIFEVSNEANVLESFRQSLSRFFCNELLRLLVVGWIFISFLQGVTGFGVPVAIGALLLTGMGVKPFYAVVIALIGQAWGNTFGTLGVAWDALVFQIDPEGAELVRRALVWSCLFTWLMDIAAGLTICYLYDGFMGVRAGLPAVIALSIIHGGGQMIIAIVNPALSNFMATSIAFAGAFWLGRTKLYSLPAMTAASGIMSAERLQQEPKCDITETGSIHLAAIPYYALVGLTITAMTLQAAGSGLGDFQVGFPFPETVTVFGHVNKAVACYTPIIIFTHAGTLLFLSALAGFWMYRRMGLIGLGGKRRIFRRTLESTLPSAVSTIGLVVMAKVMYGSGQIEVLAKGVSLLPSPVYAVVAPFVGALGSFITGSNLSSNILFASFHDLTAKSLGLDRGVVLAAQTAGGAIGSMTSPVKVLLGTVSVGIAGQEGEIVKRLLPLALLVTSLCGIIVLGVSYL